ncbi:retrovirus-related pol polyprotein from transposon TNT 1-94 [Tanacetum coccineum]
MAEDGKIKIDKFDGHGFGFWKMQIEDYLDKEVNMAAEDYDDALDVRYIPGLKKRLILVGQLDEERYHIGFGDQQWKVSKGGNAALWHQRLGYMSEKSMKILASKGRISDLQKAVVYFLKNKSEAFNTFKKWKAAVENETNLRVKCLKSDNGEEYSIREFIEYCAENEIMMLNLGRE